MPERIFFGKDLEELDDILSALQSDAQGGAVEEQRAAGVTTRVKPNDAITVQRRIFSCRWEMYMVAKKLIRQKLCVGIPCDDPTIAGLRDDYPDPRKEIIMRVPNLSAVGVYAEIPPDIDPFVAYPIP